MRKKEILVVGAGFFGLTVAERIANTLRLPVRVIDRRDHIGGNAFSRFDPTSGIEVHEYGAHIFHTSNEQVWKYVNKFSKFNDYRHHVFSVYDGKVFSLPISLHTISQFYGRHFSPQEARDFLTSRGRGRFPTPKSLEEKAINSFGADLYEAFFRDYSFKQWEVSPHDLSPAVVGRLPVRFDFNSRYFSDLYEGLPISGYGDWHAEMVADDLIQVELGVDYFSERRVFDKFDLVVFSGPIDEYFQWKFGRLGWRTVDYDLETYQRDDFQGCSQMNFPALESPFTRIFEFKHLHPERDYATDKTIVAREFSRQAGVGDEPYYPINSQQDREALTSYRKAARAEKGVLFGGRLGSYRYLDMHMAIASALQVVDNRIAPLLQNS